MTSTTPTTSHSAIDHQSNGRSSHTRGRQQKLAALGALRHVGGGGHANVDGRAVLPRPGHDHIGLLTGVQGEHRGLDTPPAAGPQRELGLDGGSVDDGQRLILGG